MNDGMDVPKLFPPKGERMIAGAGGRGFDISIPTFLGWAQLGLREVKGGGTFPLEVLQT